MNYMIFFQFARKVATEAQQQNEKEREQVLCAKNPERDSLHIGR